MVYFVVVMILIVNKFEKLVLLTYIRPPADWIEL